MQIKLSTDEIIKQKADSLVIGVPKSGKNPSPGVTKVDKSVKGAISQYLKHADLLKSRSVHILPVAKGGYKCIALVPLGKNEPTSLAFQKSLSKVVEALSVVKAKSAVFDLNSLCGGADKAWAVRQATQALAGSAYDFKLGVPTLATRDPAKVTLGGYGKGTSKTSLAARIGGAVGYGMRVAKHLGEQPPNLLYPDSLAKFAVKAGRAAGLKTKVLGKKEIEKLRMGGLLAVGKGSEREPRLIVLRHEGGRKGVAPIVLVGKGITFDTGGNSIKPSAAMVDMKFDMCGAAGMIGTVLACAKMRLPLNVAAVVPSAENMVASNSFRPDDIITMMNGQKVEVLNTDAEGRLVLADALTYAQRFLKPNVIVDAATLTGACVVALGQHRSGMFSLTDGLADELSAAGEDSADLCWRLPLDDAYNQMLKSQVADFANIGGGRNAGTITAACFLQRFVETKQWAHLDIAGSAWQNRRASGRPVPLLATWLARRAGWIKD